tara:strand:+ start:3385 stop:5250 length:1866 start_codon:yes stop_codon:yes gene_type:complete
MITSLQYKLATIDNVVKYCQTKSVLGVDTETEGMDFTCKKVVMLQIGDEENQFVIDTRDTDIEPLRQILEDKNIIKIFHNAKFDYKFIRKSFNIKCDGIYDTFLVERIISCGKKLGYGLKDLCKRYLNVELNKDVRNQFINLEGRPYDDNQIIYGAKDVEYLIQIRDFQIPLTERHKLENVVNIENKVVLALADIEYNGIDLNRDKWNELEHINKANAIALEQELDNMIIEDARLQEFIAKQVQGDLFKSIDEIRKITVKWTSPIQVLKVFKKLLPDLENVNGKEMFKHRFKFPIIDKYIKYKEATKLCTSYGDSFFRNLASDGKIHTNFHQILDTGRVSSSKPNMQQIPADNQFRNCFTAPEGWKFVSSDYSSQELNVIAFGSKDPVWIKALENNEDLHSTCAELVYGDEWINNAEDNCVYMKRKAKCNCPMHKKLRTNVKTINFGLAYGMGPNKLAGTLNISMEQAKQLIEKYFTAFPSIKGFLDRLGNFGKKFGYIKTFPPFNRKRWFVNWYPKIWNNKSSMIELGSIERASKNTPIQGASADMTKLALVLIRNYINMTKAPVKMVMTVHDQIDTICRYDYIDEWTIKMKELMELAANTIVTNGLLTAEVTISDCWQK